MKNRYPLVFFYLFIFIFLTLPNESFGLQQIDVAELQQLSFESISDELELAKDRDGNSWIRGEIDTDLLGKEVMFRIPTARIYQYDLYLWVDGQLMPVKRDVEAGSGRFPKYRFKAEALVYYIHIQQDLPTVVPVSVNESHVDASQESSKLLGMGAYYGLALMSIVFNIVFFFAFHEKSFLTYAILLFTTFLSSFYEDGMFYYLSAGQWTMDYLLVWTTGISAISALLFTYYFLGLEVRLKRYRNLFYIATTLLFSTALTYNVTGYKVVSYLSYTLCFCYATSAIFLAILRFRKDVYARFLVLSFSMVVLTGIFYVLHTYVDSAHYASFNMGVFRTVSGLEVIIISFAIIFRVKALQEEKERYREELDKYLKQWEYEHNINNDITFETDGLDHFTIFDRKQLAEELGAQYELTEREVEVMCCIWEGLTNQETANKLCISLSTVKYHVSNLYLKLDVKNRNQLQVFRDMTNRQQVRVVATE